MTAGTVGQVISTLTSALLLAPTMPGRGTGSMQTPESNIPTGLAYKIIK